VTDSKEISVGESLSAARKKKRLRYKKLSSELNIDASYLIALEEENYGLIPGGDAYVKGFLRSYAKKLDLDPDEVIKDFNLSIKGSSESNRWGSLKSERKQEGLLNKKTSFTLVSVFILIVIAAFFLTFISNSIETVQVESNVAVSEKPLELPSEESVDLISEDLTAPADLTQMALEEDKINDPVTFEVKKNITFIEVRDECWLEVFSQNERLLYKLAIAGERFEFDSDVIMVTAGNFRNIDVLFNDKIVDLGANANAANVSCVVLPAGDCSEFRTPNN
tara:strand:- start:1665 stop:2501 length:837 start_codon:yes stop_codon:yes gene_type:complete